MRLKVLCFLAVLLYAAGAISQTAKVIALSPGDAREARALDDAQKVLNARREKFEDRITTIYLQDKRSDEGCERGTGGPPYRPCATLNGWAGGFIFSDDFKYIVPRPYPAITSPLTNAWTVPAYVSTFVGNQ